MKLRLDRQAHIVSKREVQLILAGIVCIALILMPSVERIKTLLIQGGYRMLHTNSSDEAMQILSDLKAVPGKLLSAERDIPTLRLDIKYKEWQKLVSDRQTALADGLIPETRQFAKAVLYDDKTRYSAKIRLQGDLLDHVSGEDRWSLRVEIKKKKALFSTSRFALISSNVRSHQGPELFRQSMITAGFDIIAPQNYPVNVIVNGDDWGVMLLEQAFGQDLLATSNRTEGFVVRLDLTDEQVNSQGERHRELKARVIQKKTVMGKEALAMQRQIALTLISDFIDGKRSASDVFDTKRIGQYLATVDIWGAWHALTWNNWRWYYNPHTAKLEPIQSDVLVSPARHTWLMKPPTRSSLISRKMLDDPQVAESYEQAMSHLKQLINSGELIEALEKEQDTYNKMLYPSVPLLGRYDFDIMKRQAGCIGSDYQTPPCSDIRELGEHIHLQMHTMSARRSWELMTSFLSTPSGSALSVTNSQNKVLTIKEIQQLNKDGSKTLLTPLNIELPRMLPPNSSITMALPGKVEKIAFDSAFEGKKTTTHSLQKDRTANTFIPRPQATSKATQYPFIKRSHDQWEIQSGTWKIDDYLVTPDNWQVHIQPGTRLEFSENAGLMVFGELFTHGTDNKPVVFTKQARSESWSGLTVFGTESTKNSRVNHLRISHARSPKLGFWQPRGAAYFINGDLQINHLTVTDNSSEDALNIISSKVSINHLSVKNALSDGFDCDFCTGEINNSQFLNIGFVSGGDGLDTSGSSVIVRHSLFDGIRDKAVSAGENSHLVLEDSRVQNSNIAVASKDRSKVTINRGIFDNIREYSLMSYIKKNIFGPATLHANDTRCTPVSCIEKTLVEKGSVLTIDGSEVTAEDVNVKALYKGIMKSDKPK